MEMEGFLQPVFFRSWAWKPMRELSSPMSSRNLSSNLFPPFQSYDMNVVTWRHAQIGGRSSPQALLLRFSRRTAFRLCSQVTPLYFPYFCKRSALHFAVDLYRPVWMPLTAFALIGCEIRLRISRCLFHFSKLHSLANGGCVNISLE